MKSPIIVCLSLVLGVFKANASKITVPVVVPSAQLQNKALWKNIPVGETPLTAIEMREIEAPSKATSKIYLQNERVKVCYETCSQFQPTIIASNGKIDLKYLDSNPYLFGVQRDMSWKKLKLINTYYWSNKLFDYLARLGYQQKKQLTIIVDRKVINLEDGSAFTDNAFFVPTDWSLNFLPIDHSIQNVLSGYTWHSPALDASVIMHEASHSVVETLIPRTATIGYDGIQEGFADYFAMAVLNDTEIGTIFLGGTPVRQIEEKTPRLSEVPIEGHEIGQVLNSAAQRIRKLFNNKPLIDLVFLNTLKTINTFPYINVEHLPILFNEQLSHTNNPNINELQNNADTIWNYFGFNTNKDSLMSYQSFPTSISDVERQNYFELTNTISLSDRAASLSTAPQFTSSRISLLYKFFYRDGEINVRSNKLQDKVGLKARISHHGKNEIVYVLFNSRTGAIQSVFDENKNLLKPNTPERAILLSAILDSSNGLKDAYLLQQGGEDFGLYLKKYFSGYIESESLSKYAKQLQTITQKDLNLKSYKSVKITETSVQFKRTLYGKALSFLGKDPLRGYNSIKIYTVNSKDVPQLKTPRWDSYDRIIGYQIETSTGLTSKTLITDLTGDVSLEVPVNTNPYDFSEKPIPSDF